MIDVGDRWKAIKEINENILQELTGVKLFHSFHNSTVNCGPLWRSLE